MHGKNGFAEVSKHLDLKIILLDHQNNYIKSLSIDSNAAKSFNILTSIRASYITILMIQTKLFLDLYLAKFLDTSAKSFFSLSLTFKKLNLRQSRILKKVYF